VIKHNSKKSVKNFPSQNMNGKTQLLTPGPLFVTNGAFRGEINLQWDAVKDANHYVIEISKNGSLWKQVDIISDPHYSMQGLTSGKNYSFRVSAIYNAGQSGWSNAVTKKIK
jgi:hypothetical protein